MASGNSVTISSANTSDNLFFKLQLKRATTDYYATIRGNSSDNIKSSTSPGSGNYYVTLDNPSTVKTNSSRTPVSSSASSYHKIVASNPYTFYLIDSNGNGISGKTVRFRYSSDTGTSYTDYRNTGTNGSFSITTPSTLAGNLVLMYVDETDKVEVTYTGANSSSNKANVRASISGKTTTLDNSAEEIDKGKSFSFTVTPKSSANGIRLDPSVKVTIGGKSYTPTVSSASISSITYSIPASAVTGDIVISEFKDIDEIEYVNFNTVPNLTIAQRNDSYSAMQPFSNNRLAVVSGDNAVVRVTPAKGYELTNPAATDSSDKAISGVSYSDRTGLFTIPASQITNGMTVKTITTVAEAKKAEDTAATQSFTDVPKALYPDYFDAIEWAAANGIVQGVGNNRFNPDGPASRAQFTTMMHRYLAAKNPGSPRAVSKFRDVSGLIADYTNAILWAESLGPALIEGITPTTFEPNMPITRAQVVTILWRAANKPVVTGLLPFYDLPQNWYQQAIAWGVQTGIVRGTSATTFTPDRPVTRAELATFLYRAIVIAKVI